MANGFHGTREEWERMEAPLLALDEALTRFAQEKGVELEKNYHSLPNRRLTWNRGGVTRSMQITIQDENAQTLYVTFFAWQDKGRDRYGKWVRHFDGISPDALREDLTRLLEEGYETLAPVSEADLEFWTRLKG
ncbi:MAG TPA: hypothetical protein VF591_21780 [Pyrinomonadaceae bacterium]|jgi:hypothetical protein